MNSFAINLAEQDVTALIADKALADEAIALIGIGSAFSSGWTTESDIDVVILRDIDVFSKKACQWRTHLLDMTICSPRALLFLATRGSEASYWQENLVNARILYDPQNVALRLLRQIQSRSSSLTGEEYVRKSRSLKLALMNSMRKIKRPNLSYLELNQHLATWTKRFYTALCHLHGVRDRHDIQLMAEHIAEIFPQMHIALEQIDCSERIDQKSWIVQQMTNEFLKDFFPAIPIYGVVNEKRFPLQKLNNRGME